MVDLAWLLHASLLVIPTPPGTPALARMTVWKAFVADPWASYAMQSSTPLAMHKSRQFPIRWLLRGDREAGGGNWAMGVKTLNENIRS